MGAERLGKHDGEHGLAGAGLAFDTEATAASDRRDQSLMDRLNVFEAVLVAETRLVAPSAEIRSFPWLVSRFEGRSERPSMPPPRV